MEFKLILQKPTHKNQSSIKFLGGSNKTNDFIAFKPNMHTNV